MDDRRFDTVVRNLASGTSRRTLLKGILGLGGVAAVGVELHQADAARRGFSGPVFPTEVPTEPPCANPPSCASGQLCCDGFRCCNGDCIPEGDECGVS